MNPELEAIIQAYDALRTAPGADESERLQAIYESRLDDALAHRPTLSRDTLKAMVRLAHSRWLKAQNKRAKRVSLGDFKAEIPRHRPIGIAE